MSELFTRGDIAKLAGLTGQAITNAVQRRELTPVARTGSGILLFEKEAVQQFLESRRQRSASAHGGQLQG